MQSAVYDRSALVFQFPKCSAPHEPAAGGDEMGGGVREMMKVSQFLMCISPSLEESALTNG